MNCRDFESSLESLIDRRLEPAARDACLLHAESCSACGELLTAVGGLHATDSSLPEEALVGSILTATVGSVCDQAKPLLPSFVDRKLATADRDLVELHLASCDGCRRLSTTLVTLRQELPLMAEVDVDARFTADVLASTVPTPSRFRSWLTDQWSSWVQRPRFAMEAAYVGVLVLMLVLGAFSTPVAALPQKGVELLQPEADTSSVWMKTQEGLGTFWDSVASLFEKVERKQESTKETP